jgi:hypothetical protein
MAKRDVINRGTTDFLDVIVRADVDLGAQTVAVSFDRTTWLPATWIGDVGITRSCRVLIDASNIPDDRNAATVFVRVTDTPEVPVISAGLVKIL